MTSLHTPTSEGGDLFASAAAPAPSEEQSRNPLIEEVGASSTDSEPLPEVRSDQDPFRELSSAVERAQEYADRFDKAYRPEIFRVALDLLLSGGTTPVRGTSRELAQTQGNVRTYARDTARSASAQDGTSEVRPSGSLTPIQKLARALDVDVVSVQRIVHFRDDSGIDIIGRVPGDAKRELQRKYSLVYLYVKEKALGEQKADVEELRTLCLDHGCYDVANFTANFRRDGKSGYLREIGSHGSRSRQYMATKKGLDEAEALLREMAKE